jgi:hypothetical protein
MIQKETFVALINEMIAQAKRDYRFGQMLDEFLVFPDGDLSYNTVNVFLRMQHALIEVFHDDKELIDNFFDSVFDPCEREADWIAPKAEDLYDELTANMAAREDAQRYE